LNFVNLGRSGKPLLTGDVITDARSDFDQFARPSVSMTMNASGARTWAKITATASTKQPQGRIAIVLDNNVYTAPTVQGEIPNGNSQITGNFTTEEAKDLALVLKAGSLPAPTRIVEQAIVGSSLGQVAQNQGLISMGAGLGLDCDFHDRLLFERWMGGQSGIDVQHFLHSWILAQFNAALTLPGIAVLFSRWRWQWMLTWLIYERIKEEMKMGRKLRDAIKKGYERPSLPSSTRT